MPGKIAVRYLRKEDLEYELKVRGVAIGSVDTMRSSLAATLRREAANESFSYPSYPFTFDEDEVAVNAKLADLEQAVTSFSGVSTSPEALRLQTQINHVLGRIDRMIPPLGDDRGTTEQRKADLLSRILTLSNSLHDKLHPPSCDMVPAALSVFSTLNQSFQGGLTQVHASSPSASSIQRVTTLPEVTSPTSTKMIPPHKWGIEKFSGSSKGMSISGFFEMIEELRLARHVPESILLESGIDLFSEKAYQFYKDVRFRVGT